MLIAVSAFAILSIVFGAAPAVAFGSDPPYPAAFRSEFEAQFPTCETNEQALELERLSAPLGIDLVPKPFAEDPAALPDAAPTVDDGRTHPTLEASELFQSLAVGAFVRHELGVTDEGIGRPSAQLENFLSDHDGEIATIQSVIRKGSGPQWGVNVSQGSHGPTLSFLGIIQLQRLLLARALVAARVGNIDEALENVESSWRLNDALAVRPELICQIILLASARLQAGTLRKIDSPAYGWADRLRDRRLYLGFLAALQNEVWFWPGLVDLTGDDGSYGRVLRRVADEIDLDPCIWSPETLKKTWAEAVQAETRPEGEESWMADIMPNLANMVMRWRRYIIDAELTALVLDARAQRAASRRNGWPAKLLSVGFGPCPRARWVYLPLSNGTARIAFESSLLDENESMGPLLPLEFIAGIPSGPGWFIFFVVPSF